MVCRKQFRFHKIPISNLWEVHLDVETWDRMKKAAYLRNCSFSWISRYCVFRLARKKSLKMHSAMEILSKEVKTKHKNSKSYHRHIICLYGDDEKLLRITAMQLNMTVSHLIRFALTWFLPKMESKLFDNRHIYYYGTKICRYLDLSRKTQLKLPFYDTIFYTKWPIESWWRRPYPFIPIPFTPGNKISKLYGLLSSGLFDWRIVKWHLER